MITLVGKPLDGLVLFENYVYEDERGYFSETYVEREIRNLGIMDTFVQENHSCSKKGVLRGLHFQKKYAQAQIVRVIKGEIFDVAVNINPNSCDFGKHFGVRLCAESHRQFYMSADYAHGFMVLSEQAEVLYKCSQYYHPEDESGIIYNDQILQIEWPYSLLKSEELIVSEKDLSYQSFKEYMDKY